MIFNLTTFTCSWVNCEEIVRLGWYLEESNSVVICCNKTDNHAANWLFLININYWIIWIKLGWFHVKWFNIENDSPWTILIWSRGNINDSHTVRHKCCSSTVQCLVHSNSTSLIVKCKQILKTILNKISV